MAQASKSRGRVVFITSMSEHIELKDPACSQGSRTSNQFWKGCKPNFVCASCEAERIICLSSQYPRLDLSVVEQAVPESPIWPCSRWGFPCPRDFSRSGGLLHHLFTLARTPKRPGGLFSVALSVDPALPESPARISRRPGVARHRAFWSSDFPPWTCARSDSPPFQN